MAETRTGQGSAPESRQTPPVAKREADLGSAAPERRPSLPPETFGQGAPLDDIGSVPPADADASTGSID